MAGVCSEMNKLGAHHLSSLKWKVVVHHAACSAVLSDLPSISLGAVLPKSLIQIVSPSSLVRAPYCEAAVYPHKTPNLGRQFAYMNSDLISLDSPPLVSGQLCTVELFSFMINNV